MGHKYTQEQREWLAANWRHLTNAEVVDEFAYTFHEEMTQQRANSYGTNRGWRKDAGVKERAIAKSRGYFGKYTQKWREWFAAYVPGHEEREISAECERVWGFPLSESQIGNWKHELGVKSGTNGGRFEKGHAPANKGVTWEEQGRSAEARARSLATCYRKGNMPHNAADIPIGYIRETKDGYLEMKVADRPERKRNAHNNWVPLHHISYEWAYGEIPDGSMVVFLDGDKANIDPTNLALETKAEHAVIARHHIPYHDRESHEVARAIARMKSAKQAARMRKK